ncbi:MAG TPA: prolyl oligopeptidase family serine peptidase [Thermoanaerobaculia bacterium]|nr:prolyl oligopeptidase family serine peptidase [Thermoanaerobaculia bacterium]
MVDDLVSTARPTPGRSAAAFACRGTSGRSANRSTIVGTPGRSLCAALPVLAALAFLVPLAGAGAVGAPAAVDQAPAGRPPASAGGVTLEMIMADPDWMGNPPEKPYWSDDGRAVYYERKQQGKELRDLFRQRLSESTPPQRIAEPDKGAVDVGGGAVSRDRKWKAYVREGDLYLKDLDSGAIRQLTRTAEAKSEPRFMAGDTRISFRVKNTYYVYDRATGLLSQPAELLLAKDPDEEELGYLERQQLRLLAAVREAKTKAREVREHARAEQRADPTRPPLPWYLGDKIKLQDVSLSPSGNWLVVVFRPKEAKEGKKAIMPAYVSESGYIEPREVRSLVGTGDGTGDCLLLLDLRSHQRRTVDLAALPGSKDDPLKSQREEAERLAKAAVAAAAAAVGEGAGGEPRAESKAGAAGSGAAGGGARVKAKKPAKPKSCASIDDEDKEDGKDKDGKVKDKDQEENTQKEDQDKEDSGAQRHGKAGDESASAGKEEGDKDKKGPAMRPIEVSSVEWTDDGRRVAVELVAADNKDRWIATLDLESGKLLPRHHLADNAWINWDHDDFGWLADNETLYYLSEETGYAHLYATSERGGSARPLTSGRFEVSNPVASWDGRYLYYHANASHPGQYDVWRVEVATGKAEQLSRLGGLTSFLLSRDESQLLLIHSSFTRHNELYVQGNQPGAEARRVTDTVSAAFSAQPWTVPEIVPVPSSHGAGVIYSRLYKPAAQGAAAGEGVRMGGGPAGRPAVVFIHGAGYLQDAHFGWSFYFHEFMFHTLLAQRGYVVLDMDYRASAGYGRDWRTAIYRQMGHPELEDLEDGVNWLVAQQGVDRSRVGVYGGSYGGFLTLMALFRSPDLFAAGAALRPVTDWTHYNHGYTSAILNTPEVDPQAFERSSPIEFAAGLKRPLLICAGMVDDNVFFQDDVRLVQRLIELQKENFELAIFPVESHGFKRPDSWLDEYRRIYKLFSAHLR